MDKWEGYMENLLNELPEERKKTLLSYSKSLHNSSTHTRYIYLNRLKVFGDHFHKPYESVLREDIDTFLSTIKADGTYNAYVNTLKSFYKWLGKKRVVKGLKPRKINISISPSELLSPEEVVRLASATGSVMWKALVLTLFESAARLMEVLRLKIGDVEFHSVRTKDGGRGLVATLYFKRSKGKVNKEPVALTMFATELKAWLEAHPYKDNPHAFLFYSAKYSIKADKPLVASSVRAVLNKSKKVTKIKKKVNPHWLRHSMLSYLANELNYNEQFLMWRAGWKNTGMARRYIHSGGAIENSEYLERMGYIVEERKREIIKPRPCPHCNQLNPYTNNACDFCGMPLELDEYRRVLKEKRKPEDMKEIAKLREKVEKLTKIVEGMSKQLTPLLELQDRLMLKEKSKDEALEAIGALKHPKGSGLKLPEK